MSVTAVQLWGTWGSMAEKKQLLICLPSFRGRLGSCQTLRSLSIKPNWKGLSWWLSGKESTCQHRRHGKISGQLDPCVTTAEPTCATTEVQAPGAHAQIREATARRSPRTVTREEQPEKAHSAMKTQSGHQFSSVQFSSVQSLSRV